MIRPIRNTDAGQIADIYNYYVEKTIVTFEEDAVTAEEMVRRIAEIIPAYPWFVYEDEGNILGYAYARRWKGRRGYRYSVETTVYLRNGFAGKGLGTMLYTELIGKLKEMEIHAAIGGIALPNEPSRRLHEKLGFQKVAEFKQVGLKFGNWIDVGYWELILSPQ